LLHFVELLIGPKCGSIQVDNPEQYSFDRPGLMESVLSLLVLLASVSYKDAGKAFVQAIAQEPDLDLGVLNQVCAVSALCFEEVTSLPRCGQGPCYSIRTQSGSESAEPGAGTAGGQPPGHVSHSPAEPHCKAGSWAAAPF